MAYNGPHQYSVTFGAPNLRQAIAKKQGKAIGREIDPDQEIVITCGGTEAMMCAMMTICNPSNPCGKVFTREELMAIGSLAVKYDAYVVTDEVYEQKCRLSGSSRFQLFPRRYQPIHSSSFCER